MTRRGMLWTCLVLLVLWGAYAVRMSYIGADSIWHDEAWSIRAFRGPFTTPDDNTPYLYYLAGHGLWRLGGGESPLALRYVSVLLGVLTVAAALRIGGRWFGRRWGWLGAALVALSPLLWAYAQEVRAYVAVPLIALGMIAVADAIASRQPAESVPRRVWAWAFLVQIVGLYTHNLSVPLIVWLNAALGLLWLWRRDFRKMFTWAGVEIVLIVCYIPWLLTQSPSGTPLNTPPTPGLQLIGDIWASYFFPVQQQLLDAKNGAGAVNVLTAVLVLGALSALMAGAWFALKPGRRVWILLSHAALVPALSTGLMMAANIDFHPRYYIAAVPGTLLLIVGAGATLTARPARPLRGVGSLLYLLILLCAVLMMARTQFQIRTQSQYRHDDFRGIAEYYSTLPEDAVILIPFEVERALQDYYADILNIRAQFINIPLYSDEATALQAINALVNVDAPRHVEFLTWYQLPADVRGMYPCLLAAGSAEVAPPRFYFGLSTQAFVLDRAVSFQPIQSSARFAGVDDVSVAYAATPTGACVKSTWAFPTNLMTDASAALALLNPFDGVIARDDAEIRRDDNAPTSAWDAGESGTAYALLTLPEGAPLAEYTLTVGVYDALNPSGYDVLDSAGNPAGKSARYVDAIRAQGAQHTLTTSAWVEDNAGADRTFQTGLPLDVTAYVLPSDAPLTLSGEGWTLEAENTDGLLTWARFIVPAGETGEAVLRAGERELQRYTVVDVPRIFAAPEVDIPLEVEFVDVGVLVGLTITGDDVTLVWRAAGNTPISYTVFVQRLNAEGRVVAQSDNVPADQTRPTLGWVAGEYIIDTHRLAASQTAATRLIIGLYNPADFVRVPTSTGATYAEVMP